MAGKKAFACQSGKMSSFRIRKTQLGGLLLGTLLNHRDHRSQDRPLLPLTLCKAYQKTGIWYCSRMLALPLSPKMDH